jgi:hypothetical protein
MTSPWLNSFGAPFGTTSPKSGWLPQPDGIARSGQRGIGVAFFGLTGEEDVLPDIVAFRLSQVVEKMLVTSRRRLAQLADRVEFLIRVEEAKRDPGRRDWAAQMKAAVDDGSLLREIEAQRTPEEILREWRAATSV